MGRKIAVNTRLLLANKLEGIGVFTSEVFKIISRNNPDDEFHFIFDRPFDNQFIFSDNIKAHIIQPPVRHPLLVKIWYNFQIPRLLKKIKADIFISPDAIASLKTEIPQLTVIHDINFVHRPKDLPNKWSVFYNKYTPLFLEKSKRIATVSEYSKKDIHSTYKTDLTKIDVVYNGVKLLFRPIEKEITQKTTHASTNGNPFFFFVGSLHPRKNLKNLLLAFNEFKKMDDQNHQLILGGEIMFKFDEIQATFDQLEFKKNIHFTGRLSDYDLNCYLSEAVALTYIPFFEGFGIPVLEAMACDTPVITSNVTSLPEVVEDAAIQVSPNSISEIATSMLEISSNLELRNELIQKGRERVHFFTWEKSANSMWNSILKTLEK